MVTNFGTYIANNSPRNYRPRFSALSNISSSIGGALGTSLMGVYIGLKDYLIVRRNTVSA